MQNLPEEFLKRLVEMANALPDMDSAAIANHIQDHELVFGVWQDSSAPNGVEAAVIKGEGQLSVIVHTSQSQSPRIAAIRCRNQEECHALSNAFGDKSSLH